MERYPQQLSTAGQAEQAAASTFLCLLFLVQKMCLFRNSVFWGPQALFTAEQAAADVFPLGKLPLFVVQERKVLVNN